MVLTSLPLPVPCRRSAPSSSAARLAARASRSTSCRRFATACPACATGGAPSPVASFCGASATAHFVLSTAGSLHGVIWRCANHHVVCRGGDWRRRDEGSWFGSVSMSARQFPMLRTSSRCGLVYTISIQAWIRAGETIRAGSEDVRVSRGDGRGDTPRQSMARRDATRRGRAL